MDNKKLKQSIFEILKQDDRLFAPKALDNWKRYTKDEEIHILGGVGNARGESSPRQILWICHPSRGESLKEMLVKLTVWKFPS